METLLNNVNNALSLATITSSDPNSILSMQANFGDAALTIMFQTSLLTALLGDPSVSEKLKARPNSD